MATAFPDIPSAELCAVVRAVRAHPRRDKDLRVAVAVFAVFLAIFLHSATPAAWNPSSAQSRAHKENQMLSPRQIAVVSSLALSSAAVAQNAVQWRVEDGGNGHWYTVVGTPQSWQASRSASESVGGHLLSIGSDAEAVFLRSVWSDACWIGLFQDRTASDYLEPTGGWRWVTGEELTFTHWRINTNGQPNEPNNLGGGEDWALIDGFATTWNDASSALLPFAVEWSADCNADGIVDYGQIRNYQLVDDDLDNIPDCCEQASGCRSDVIEWRIADGGNGHWYGLTPIAQRWPSANDAALVAGGVLASLGSPAENSFAANAFAGQRMWIGARRSSTNFNQFIWVDGTPFEFASWQPGEPNTCNPCGQAEFVSAGNGLWDDTGLIVNGDQNHPGYRGLIEWSADCNADGIVDYGQIRAGDLLDANANNVPDCCESSTGCCPGDVDGSGAVNGVDLAAVLGNWGTNGGKYPGADTNHDGVVDGMDLAQVLGNWGPCN